MWAIVWRAAYRRLVRSSFATVPFYRERWALDGRTDPVLVPDRLGEARGATEVTVLAHRLPDLVPLAGGEDAFDPLRGLGSVLHACVPMRPDALVVVLGYAGLPSDLPGRARACHGDAEVIEPALRRGDDVIAVGTAKELALLAETLPRELADRVRQVPTYHVDDRKDGPYGLLVDDTLGVLGGLRQCGRWHLDWQRVYARELPQGIAFSLLRQRSPRVVDAIVSPVRARLGRCPRHGTPVVLR